MNNWYTNLWKSYNIHSEMWYTQKKNGKDNYMKILKVKKDCLVIPN